MHNLLHRTNSRRPIYPLALLLWALIALPSMASVSDLSRHDWQSPDDGLVVYDQSTGLEWLSLTVTRGMSIQDTEAQTYFDNSGSNGRFRWATNAEIVHVINHLSWLSLSGDEVGQVIWGDDDLGVPLSESQTVETIEWIMLFGETGQIDWDYGGGIFGLERVSQGVSRAALASDGTFGVTYVDRYEETGPGYTYYSGYAANAISDGWTVNSTWHRLGSWLVREVIDGANVINNGSFEASDISGWLNLEGSASVGAPAAGAQDGNYAAVLAPESPGTGASIILQNFLARPGDEIYASGHMLTEIPLVDDPAFRIIKLSFYDLGFNPFRLIELTPESISKGVGGAGLFPGIEGLPLLDSSSALNTWQLTQSQGVAPVGTKLASVLLLNINETGSAAPIWFDNIVATRLAPDMDSDGIANDIDTDPLTATDDFSNGTTSGTITDRGNQILTINDEAALDGIRITASASGGSGVAKIQVCGASGTLVIRADSGMVVTCGSVILYVEPESTPVDMEFIFNGEIATVTVPAEYAVAYEPETATVDVIEIPTGPEPEPVTLSVGGAEVPIVPGETLTLLSIEIDIKPGSDPNCFNKNGHGVIPVAILGSGTFDVSDTDQDSLAFGGLMVRMRGNKGPMCGLEDTNGDGLSDLVCHFEDDASNWSMGSDTATITGRFLDVDGTLFTGTDSICVVP